MRYHQVPGEAFPGQLKLYIFRAAYVAIRISDFLPTVTGIRDSVRQSA